MLSLLSKKPRYQETTIYSLNMTNSLHDMPILEVKLLGGKGQSCPVKGPWGLLVKSGILPGWQFVWRGAWPSDIPPCCHLTSSAFSIFAFHRRHCQQLHPPPGLFSPLVLLSRPSHIFICLRWLDFSFFQISSVPLLQTLLQIISVMRAVWCSDWASGSLRCQVLNRGMTFL